MSVKPDAPKESTVTETKGEVMREKDQIEQSEEEGEIYTRWLAEVEGLPDELRIDLQTLSPQELEAKYDVQPLTKVERYVPSLNDHRGARWKGGALRAAVRMAAEADPATNENEPSRLDPLEACSPGTATGEVEVHNGPPSRAFGAMTPAANERRVRWLGPCNSHAGRSRGRGQGGAPCRSICRSVHRPRGDRFPHSVRQVDQALPAHR